MDLSKYYAEICKTPILTREEEAELVNKFFDDSTPESEKSIIRENLIKANMRYVFNLARKYSKNDPTTFADLIAAGNEGLTVGVDKYTPGRGTRVISYAHFWVRQRILEEMASMRLVALPVYKQQLSSKIERIKSNNESITLDELKSEFKDTGISEKDIEDLYKTRYLTFHIEDMDESNFEINPIEEYVQRMIDDNKVFEAVKKLESPYREVVAKCFGMQDGKEQSISKIGRDLKIPKDQIQDIKEKGLEMLREILRVN